jgi:hypothetical protein
MLARALIELAGGMAVFSVTSAGIRTALDSTSWEREEKVGTNLQKRWDEQSKEAEEKLHARLEKNEMVYSDTRGPNHAASKPKDSNDNHSSATGISGWFGGKSPTSTSGSRQASDTKEGYIDQNGADTSRTVLAGNNTLDILHEYWLCDEYRERQMNKELCSHLKPSEIFVAYSLVPVVGSTLFMGLALLVNKRIPLQGTALTRSFEPPKLFPNMNIFARLGYGLIAVYALYTLDNLATTSFVMENSHGSNKAVENNGISSHTNENKMKLKDIDAFGASIDKVPTTTTGVLSSERDARHDNNKKRKKLLLSPSVVTPSEIAQVERTKAEWMLRLNTELDKVNGNGTNTVNKALSTKQHPNSVSKSSMTGMKNISNKVKNEDEYKDGEVDRMQVISDFFDDLMFMSPEDILTPVSYPEWPGAGSNDPYSSLRFLYHLGIIPVFSVLFFQGLLLPRFAVAYGPKAAFAMTSFAFAQIATYMPIDVRPATCRMQWSEEFTFNFFKSLLLSSLYSVSSRLIFPLFMAMQMETIAILDEIRSRRDVCLEKTKLWKVLIVALKREILSSYVYESRMKTIPTLSKEDQRYLSNLSHKIMQCYATGNVTTKSGIVEKVLSGQDIVDIEVALSWANNEDIDKDLLKLKTLKPFDFPSDVTKMLLYKARILSRREQYPNAINEEVLEKILLRWANSRVESFPSTSESHHRQKHGLSQPQVNPVVLLRSLENGVMKWHNAGGFDLFALWSQVCRDAEDAGQVAAHTYMKYHGAGHCTHLLPFPMYTQRMVDKAANVRYANSIKNLPEDQLKLNYDYGRWASAGDDRQMCESLQKYGLTYRRLATLVHRHLKDSNSKRRHGKAVDQWQDESTGEIVTFEIASSRAYQESDRRNRKIIERILMPNKVFNHPSLPSKSRRNKKGQQ